MELQLNLRLVVALSLFLTLSCTKNKSLLGDWEAWDSEKSYAEFYITKDKIQIYHEIAGTLPFHEFKINSDSLVTSNLNYKINWINSDSLVLINKYYTIQLKRINEGFKLSDINSAEEKQIYLDSFWNRRNYYYQSNQHK